MLAATESMHWKASLRVDKFDVDQTLSRLGYEPAGDELAREGRLVDSIIIPHNSLTTAGVDHVTKILIGNTSLGTFTNTLTRLAVGDSSTAFATSQTDLQATTNKYYMTMSTGYPIQSNGTMTFVATFSTSIANFVWAEWGLVVSPSAGAAGTTKGTGTLINRKVQAIGTKNSSLAWLATASITLS